MNAEEIIRNVLGKGVDLCVVTKNRSIAEVKRLLRRFPDVRIIGENRWPECDEKFVAIAERWADIERHFIGHLQGNKVGKVVPLVEMIQSVDSMNLLRRINRIADENEKIMRFCFQVNVSKDPAKSGISVESLNDLIKEYLEAGLSNVGLCGLMTMGEAADINVRKTYYSEFKNIFDRINEQYFPNKPLKVLSMGTSDDYLVAIECGASMVRIGREIFE